MKDERDRRVPPNATRAWWHRLFGHPAGDVEAYAYMWLLCRRCGDIGPLPPDDTGAEDPLKRALINEASKSMNRKPLKMVG